VKIGAETLLRDE